jgi:hypothetical protein
MAQARAQNMTGGMTEANITAANTAVGTYFMVNDVLHTQPINPLMQNSGIAAGVDQNMKNYGMTIAAISQEAKNLGMPQSSGMVAAMMDDASDGVMNGKMGSTRISMNGMGGMSGGGMTGGGTMMQATAGTSELAMAMTQFMGSTLNKSGLTATDVQALINQLTSSNGTL